MNALELLRNVKNNLQTVYDEQEAQALSFILLEHFSNHSKTELLTNLPIPIEGFSSSLAQAQVRLLNEEPIQYILGEAYFYEDYFIVSPDVLIPRPETEELVHLIYTENKATPFVSILDLGTGSGCIACTLKTLLPQANLLALDFSEAALAIARKNAAKQKVSIRFLHYDLLTSQEPLPIVDVLVSNPPYIPEYDKGRIKKNVLDFEPISALFVPDADPLLFYTTILKKSLTCLKPGGKLYFEIHESFGEAIGKEFEDYGFQHIQLLKDLSGKDRIVSGRKGEG